MVSELMVSIIMLFFSILAFANGMATAAGNKTMLVVGDSWGSDGPSWKEMRDMFARHGVPAEVKSAAKGGTTACQWAGEGHGTALIEATKELFPHLPEGKGPDFVWYTLGGNDLVDHSYTNCSSRAKSVADQLRCLDAISKVIDECTDLMLEAFWEKYPNSVVVQCGYDLPCEQGQCIPQPRNPYCGTNVTCMNLGAVYFQRVQVDARAKRYPRSKYIGLDVLGTVQAAGGVPGAAVGKPILDKGSPCSLMTGCVHPIYNKSGAIAIAEAFWNLYFKNATR